MPRQRSRSTSPEVRDRNTRDILGRPGLAGMVRTGGRAVGRGRGQQSVVQQPFPDVETFGAAQLLVLSATGDSIASGGDHVEFDAVVAQHGFDGVVQPAGGYWVHPIAGVYSLHYKHEWQTYEGGGLVWLELDGLLIPEGEILPAGDVGQAGFGWVDYRAPAGSIGRVWIVQESGAAQLCDAVVSVAITDPDQTSSPEAWPLHITDPIAERPASPAGETFHDVTVSSHWDGTGAIWLSGSSDSATALQVDDEVVIDVTHQDGSTASYSVLIGTSAAGPYEITSIFEVGSNEIRVRLKDYEPEGVNISSSAVWLVKV